MTEKDQEWVRDFFGPLRVWMVVGIGAAMMASIYFLGHLVVAPETSFVIFIAGACITIVALTCLCALGRRSWQAFFWIFHTDDNDLIMGRKK